MGAKTWMLVYADADARDGRMRRPALDRDATATPLEPEASPLARDQRARSRWTFR